MEGRSVSQVARNAVERCVVGGEVGEGEGRETGRGPGRDEVSLGELPEHLLEEVELDVQFFQPEGPEVLFQMMHMLEERFGGNLDGGFVVVDFRFGWRREGQPVGYAIDVDFTVGFVDFGDGDGSLRWGCASYGCFAHLRGGVATTPAGSWRGWWRQGVGVCR